MNCGLTDEKVYLGNMTWPAESGQRLRVHNLGDGRGEKRPVLIVKAFPQVSLNEADVYRFKSNEE